MDRYAVIGHPVEHSLSPKIHQLFAQQTGQELSYEKLPAALNAFANTLEDFFARGGRGVNVTVPFKEQAAVWVDELSGGAKDAGVVNTIAPMDGVYWGYNTDGVGLVRDLNVNLNAVLAGKRLLLLGAGGAARGIVRPLLDAGLAHITLANRTPAKAEALVHELAREFAETDLRASSLASAGGEYDLVVNATSAGLTGTGDLVAAAAVRGALCYDLVYAGADETTPFCRWAQAAGAAATFDGLGMLVEQAAEAFLIWRGVRPDTLPVLRELRP